MSTRHKAVNMMEGSIPDWITYAETIGRLLRGLCVTEAAGASLDVREGLDAWQRQALDLRGKNSTIFFVGNGASASMASHCAADLMKNGGVHTCVFTDLSLLTAIGNDLSYGDVFALPLSRCMKPGDMLVAVSSSGASPNILKAVRTARQGSGLVVTLSAFAENNPLRESGHLNFYVPATTYGLAESCHAALLHYWMDGVIAAGA